MNTKELENCLHLISYWTNIDQTVVNIMLNEEINLDKEFIEPFKRELNINLLSKDTFEAKKDLMKYYVFEFMDLQSFWNTYKEMLFGEGIITSNYTPRLYSQEKNGVKIILDEYENYVVNSREIFENLFEEIQFCCVKYKIDFFKICDELKFDIEHLNKSITFFYFESQSDNEIGVFKNNFDNVSAIEIFKHFKAGLVSKRYLTDQELNEYLKAAFELKTIPETLFKIKDAPNKAAIEAVFYKYYKNVAGKIHGKQGQYAALLGDYFEGYKTTTVSSNFSKSVY